MTDYATKRPLFVGPEVVGVGMVKPGEIWMAFSPHPELGFAEDIELVVVLTPAEARRLTILLQSKADETQPPTQN